ncbi:MAG: hypothetical protein JSV91_02990 [Phycisphaerales bacterium]|nr:MAG: hypothetical protein JSV91_02990 [Phycisphaerales bacterium]
MAKGARVRSIDVIRRFRAALCTFIEEASVSLSEAQSEVQRTLWWLQNDQVRNWQQQIRKRSEKVAQAKSELYRAQMAPTSDGSRPSCVEERKLLARAEAALDEAETKLKRSKHWARVLDREQLMYRGQTQPLSSMLTADLPRAVAKMERMIENLQAYVDIAPPTTEVTGIAGAEEEPAPSMARPVEERDVGEEEVGEEVGGVSEYASLRRFTPDKAVRDGLRPAGPPITEEEDRLVEPSDPNVLRRLDLEGNFVSLSDKVVVAENALEGRRIYLERTADTSPGDSGWFVGTVPDEAEADQDQACVAMTVSEMLQHRPALRDVLALPAGYLAVFGGDALMAVLNARDEDLWKQGP